MNKILFFITVFICCLIKSQANETLKELNLGQIQLGKVYDNIEVEALSPHLFRREYALTGNPNFNKVKEIFDFKKRLVSVELTIESFQKAEEIKPNIISILNQQFGNPIYSKDTLDFVNITAYEKNFQKAEYDIKIKKFRQFGGSLELKIALPYMLKTEENPEKQTKRYAMFGMYQGLDSSDENTYSITFEVFEKLGKKHPKMIIWNTPENRQKMSRVYLIIDGKSEEFRTFFTLRDDKDLNAEDVVTHDILLSDDLIQSMIHAKTIEMKLENPETGYYNKVKMDKYNQLGLKILDAFLKE